MNCLLTTGEVCVLQQSPRSDLFEVHITVDAQSDTDAFRAVCQAQRWKSIVIELADDACSQPMTCTRIKGDLPAAFAHAAQVRDTLVHAGLHVCRTKIEAAPWNACVPHLDSERDQHAASAYFEHHIKLQLAAQGWQEPLKQVCDAFGAHISRNALKQQIDGSSERFATLRSHQLGYQSFGQLVQAFEQGLLANGFMLLKSVSEFCVYDSNLALDAAWYQAA
jgi:hypothetical protein